MRQNGWMNIGAKVDADAGEPVVNRMNQVVRRVCVLHDVYTIPFSGKTLKAAGTFFGDGMDWSCLLYFLHNLLLGGANMHSFEPFFGKLRAIYFSALLILPSRTVCITVKRAACIRIGVGTSNLEDMFPLCGSRVMRMCFVASLVRF